MKRFMDRRLLAVFAHPDDESFCCGGSLALAAKEGVEIHLLCATKGEDGQWHGNPYAHQAIDKEKKLAARRVTELAAAAKILQIGRVEYLGFIDGLLSNRDIPLLQQKIERKIERFRPQAIVTFDRGGVSGHIDHIVVSIATLAAVTQIQEQNKPGKDSVERLYYCTANIDVVEKMRKFKQDFPAPIYETAVQIVEYDISATWQNKKRAVMAHKSQKKDWEQLIPVWESLPKNEYFKLTLARQAERVEGLPFF